MVEDAIADLTFAIERYPDYSASYVLRGQAHNLMGEYDMAAQDLDTAQTCRRPSA